VIHDETKPLPSHSEKVIQAPLGDAEALTAKIVKAGIPMADIARLVKIFQFEAVMGVLQCFSDPEGSLSDLDIEVDDIWAIVQCNEEGEVSGDLSGIFESMLSADPTGREMRPRLTSR